MQSAIVVGANGFIGRELTKGLINYGVNVTAVVHNNNDSELKGIKSLSIISFDGSFDNLKEKLLQQHYDVMYCLAWNGVSNSLRSNYSVQVNNIQTSLDFLVLSKEIGCSKIVFSGSIMEFEVIEVTYKPNFTPSPSYIYGAAKVATHMMVMSLAKDLGVEVCWATITNTYGPGEISSRLINSTIRKCIKKIEPEFTSAIQNYDFVYIDDVIAALIVIGKSGINLHSYMIGSTCPKPLKQYLEELREAIAPDLSFKYGVIPYSGVNLPLDYFDCSLINKELGFKPVVSFKEGCCRTRDWLVNNHYE